MFWIFLLCAVLVVVYALIGWQFYKIAVMKGHPQIKYFWISFLFWFAGWLMVIALPDRNATQTVVHDTVQPNNNTSDELPEL